MKRVLILLLLLALCIGGCAHDRNRTASPDVSQSQPAAVAAKEQPQPPPQQPQQPVSLKPPVASASSEKQRTASSQNINEEKKNYGDYTEEDEKAAAKGGLTDAGGKGDQAAAATVADPIEPFNRAMYVFNDKLYFWVLKPVAEGYKAVVPEGARVSLGNFFNNLYFPIRFVNCLLQIDLKCTGAELGRFVVNTTMGIGGLFDPASIPEINIPKHDLDFGQTLGVYGVGHGFYIMWPVLGPSSPRDSINIAGEYFLYPVSYIEPWYAWFAVKSLQKVNDTSLSLGDYEALKSAAIDPYVAIRDAYIQYRKNKVDSRKDRFRVQEVRVDSEQTTGP